MATSRGVRPFLDDAERRAAFHGLRQHDRHRYRHSQPVAVPGTKRRPRLRGGQRPVGMGPGRHERVGRRWATVRSDARSQYAAGDGELVRRHGNRTHHPDGWPDGCSAINRHHAADLDDHLAVGRGEPSERQPDHRLWVRQRQRRRRRGRCGSLDRRRQDLASHHAHHACSADCELDLHGDRARIPVDDDRVPRRRRQRKHRDAVRRDLGQRRLSVLAVRHLGDARHRRSLRPEFDQRLRRRHVRDGRGEIHLGRLRTGLRHPLLQSLNQYRHARGELVELQRPAPGIGDLHERDDLRVADGDFLNPCHDPTGNDIRGGLLCPQRALFRDRRLLLRQPGSHADGWRKSEHCTSARRRFHHQRERRVQLRVDEHFPDQHRRR